MKKLFYLLLAAILCVCFCSCGKKQNDTTTENSNNVQSDAAAENSDDDSLIEFDNVVLVDDNNITIELVNFYAEDVNWVNDGKQNEKYFTVKATNKTDHEISLDPEDLYIKDESVECMIVDGSIAPPPGKSKQYSFCVYHENQPNRTPLKSLNDLYNLEGSFEGLHIYDDSSKNETLEVSFSIPDSIGKTDGDSARKDAANETTNKDASSGKNANDTNGAASERYNNLTEEELQGMLNEQELKIISSKYVVQDDNYKALYPDVLQVVLKNDTPYDIKNAVIAFVAWDKNNLPVKIKGRYDYTGGSYIKQVSCDDTNLVPGGTYGEDKGFEVDENCKIATFKAIVVSYEGFNGETWSNPLYDSWCKLYEGVKLPVE